ncbi:ALF repeat-containing protein, partial [Amycolatopsis samaneae]
MRGFRGSAIAMLTVTVLAGLIHPPAALADPVAAGSTGVRAEPSDREKALSLWKAGGPSVIAGAAAALTGSDDDVRKFLTADVDRLADNDVWNRIGQLVLIAGANTRTAASRVFDGTPADRRQFLDEGWKAPWKADIAVKVGQVMTAARPGSNVRAEGSKAIDSDNVDVMIDFLSTGQEAARDADDTNLVGQLMRDSGQGTRVWEAAQRALDGTIQDIREFLRQGYQVAAQRDQEVLSVKHLADLARDAGERAASQLQAARDAADSAIAAARRAEEAANRARKETEDAQKDAAKAGQAAGRAAEGAKRAAEAAQAAISAANVANEASRVAANAASKAAAAAVVAGQAAARARDAAVAAGRDHTKADIARDAARQARQIAESAELAAQAADAAGRASDAAGQAASAAGSAGAHADAAATA